MQADFAVINFMQHLGDNLDDLAASKYEWKGDSTTEEEFTISSLTKPIGEAYLLIQTYNVGYGDHEILINGEPLPDWDFPSHAAIKVWQTWMERIPANRLKQGTNRIQIVRSSTAKGQADDFLIRSVTVHWREGDLALPVP